MTRRSPTNRRWMADAACLDVPVRVFYPVRGEDGREAKAICARCPVRSECLDYAVAIGDRHGIWGGVNETERQRLRVRRRAS